MGKRRKKAVRENNAPIGVLDFETDPFKNGRVPKPFAACVHVPEKCNPIVIWDARRCAEITANHIRDLGKCTIYAHNGGKFDFHFLLPFAEPGKIEYRNGRVVSFKIGKALLRDSYPLIPIPLAAYKKTVIDYRKFERNRRDKHKDEILRYLLDDCRDLLELLYGFKAIIGDKPQTVGAAAFAALKDLGFKIEGIGPVHDARFRPWFFGGRVEARKMGTTCGPLQYVDINSAYPFAMMSKHPTGAVYWSGDTLPKTAGPWFARIKAVSRGCLPVRDVDGVLEYPSDNYLREYHATGWEIIAGMETGTLVVREVIEVLMPEKTREFARFVNKFWKARQAAKKRGDKIAEIAYKLVLNSGYGKWAQNPERFKEYTLEDVGTDPGGEWEYCDDIGANLTMWERPAVVGDWGYYDVAVSASITGYVRAYLWRAICASNDVIYCDTDSMIARRARVPVGDKLGEWKNEGKVVRADVAGKKLYTLKMNDGTEKTASKGAQLTAGEIRRVARGEAMTWNCATPNFHPTKGARFTKRVIKRK